MAQCVAAQLLEDRSMNNFHWASLVSMAFLAVSPAAAAGVYVTPDLKDSLLADPRLAGLFDGVRTEDELRLVVRVNADRGVDVIKTRDTDPREQVYTRRQLGIVVDEAAKHGLPVMVHAHGDEGARAAIEAGARSIEHGTTTTTTTTPSTGFRWKSCTWCAWA
jgi:hypothetical protein